MKKFIEVIMCILVVLAIAVDIQYFAIQSKKDSTYIERVMHMNQLTQAPKDDEESQAPFIFEFRYHANADGKGLEMFECLVTTFTGIDRQATYGYGVQIINPSEMKLLRFEVDSDDPFLGWSTTTYYKYHVMYNNAETYYYNTHDFVSYGATTALNKNNIPYVIEIENKPYAFTFNKQTLESEYNGFANWHFANYNRSNFDYFAYKMYDAISKITTGDGVYENLMAKLTDVFEFYEYNEATGKFDKLSDVAYNTSFIGIKTTYISRGAKVLEDSMFNQIREYNKGVIYA